MNRRNITNIKKGIIAFAIVLILILGVQWVVQYIRIDACLDKGGSWDYPLGECNCTHTIDTNRIADYYWKSDYDTIINSEYLKRGVMLDSISKSPSELIEILNIRPSKPKVEFVEIVRDTLIISIFNDTYLTEQMGTLGADCYMAETVYTLTENETIKFVRFKMNYGSHANPGLYSRNDYESIIKK